MNRAAVKAPVRWVFGGLSLPDLPIPFGDRVLVSDTNDLVELDAATGRALRSMAEFPSNESCHSVARLGSGYLADLARDHNDQGRRVLVWRNREHQETQRWLFAEPGNSRQVQRILPLADGDAVVWMNRPHEFYRLDGDTGERHLIGASHCVHFGISAQRYLWCANGLRKEAPALTRLDLSTNAVDSIVDHRCFALVCHGDDVATLESPGLVRLRNGQSGEVRWEAPAKPEVQKLAMDADVVVFHESDGIVACRAREDGNILWRTAIPAFKHEAPIIIVGPWVFVDGFIDNRLLQLTDGSVLGAILDYELEPKAVGRVGSDLFVATPNLLMCMHGDGADWDMSFEAAKSIFGVESVPEETAD
jgi:hypothetical protein